MVFARGLDLVFDDGIPSLPNEPEEEEEPEGNTEKYCDGGENIRGECSDSGEYDFSG